ncbi:cilia- and flagella-associated protein 68 isoform X3 [Ranitomeya variabilis]|uniref:cilia- and flagella-associated protein 68 isoform X3 n=2 Tax=Ranitomeya variabilis TaxID=490064 RepID=UPI0040568FF3
MDMVEAEGRVMSHFVSNLKANGHGEVWVDIRPETKFRQYGWRCTTQEDAYCHKTLIGNWNQERYDLCKLEQRRPLPSQYAHYYETSYNVDCLRNGGPAERQVFRREPHVFPGHQHELNPPQYRPPQKSCYMIDYGSSYKL